MRNLSISCPPLNIRHLKFIPVMMFFLVTSCDDNLPDYYNVKEHELQDFTRIDLGNALQVEIYQSEEFKVYAKGENRDIQDLALRVENNVLTGHYVRNRKNRKRTLVQVYLPTLTEVSLHGATTSIVSGFNEVDGNLKIKVGGASALSLDGLWKKVEVDVAGASFVNLTGSSNEMKGLVSGASRLQTLSFPVQKFEIDVSGGSEATVKVYQNLSGAVTGRSKLSYAGNPGVVSVQVSGESELQSLN